ncbi:hypothetical protein B4109_3063 [Geobacillus stearothermophilus]|uniref:Uncharacterized protein n=1 Tax=Geobacillus stearothermophilus TaxID=1422 RepID=A0A150MUZ5_GEOSE|nr:hypothetical protein B4109_3063 [Geobacillus stearothermophilus]
MEMAAMVETAIHQPDSQMEDSQATNRKADKATHKGCN